MLTNGYLHGYLIGYLHKKAAAPGQADLMPNPFAPTYSLQGAPPSLAPPPSAVVTPEKDLSSANQVENIPANTVVPKRTVNGGLIGTH